MIGTSFSCHYHPVVYDVVSHVFWFSIFFISYIRFIFCKCYDAPAYIIYRDTIPAFPCDFASSIRILRPVVLAFDLVFLVILFILLVLLIVLVLVIRVSFFFFFSTTPHSSLPPIFLLRFPPLDIVIAEHCCSTRPILIKQSNFSTTTRTLIITRCSLSTANQPMHIAWSALSD